MRLLIIPFQQALVRALKSLYRHFRGRKDDTTGTSTGPRTHGATSTGQITVHIALKEVQHLDDGTEVNTSGSMLKTADHVGDMSLSAARDFLSSNKEDREDDQDEDSRSARLEAMRRNQIGRALEARQETIDIKQEREDFRKQI